MVDGRGWQGLDYIQPESEICILFSEMGNHWKLYISEEHVINVLNRPLATVCMAKAYIGTLLPHTVEVW